MTRVAAVCPCRTSSSPPSTQHASSAAELCRSSSTGAPASTPVSRLQLHHAHRSGQCEAYCRSAPALMHLAYHKQLPFFAVLESKREYVIIRRQSMPLTRACRGGMASRSRSTAWRAAIVHRRTARSRSRKTTRSCRRRRSYRPCRTSTRMTWRHGSTTGPRRP